MSHPAFDRQVPSLTRFSPYSIANSWFLGHAMSTNTLSSLVHAILCNVSTGPFVTGWLMLGLLTFMALFAAEKRRRAHFERFQFTHLLFLPFFALWQLHGVRTALRPSS